ncbi:PucR family transcriptional regulator ligand-binding domain-containing protein [Streptomyces sp. NPDC127068]|uniref:helix-turn-helix domain-containing protein n=1 Tax=Streptomyces sp. NPDC127068 TaxID=3347127 RepID=UPI003665644C
MSIPLKALLDCRALGLTLRTGDPDAAVSWAHVSELVDPTAYVEPGTLLLTTGLGLGRTSRRWGEYAQRLVRAEVAALGFGVGLRPDGVPEALVAAAGRLGLTVVEVAESTRFGAVVRAVSDRLAAAGRAEQQRTTEAYRHLVRAALSSPAHRSVVRRLSEQLDAWVVLLSREGHLLAGSPEHARRHAERVRLEITQRPWAHGAAFDLGATRVITVPVGRAARPDGVLAVGRTTPLTGSDRAVLGVAADLISQEISRAAELLASERRERTTVLGLLLAGATGSGERAAEALGVPLPEAPVRMAVLHCADSPHRDLLEALESEHSLQIASALVAQERPGRIAVVVPTVEGAVGVLHQVVASVPGSYGVVGDPMQLDELGASWPRLVTLLDTVPPSAGERLLLASEVARVGLLSHLSGSVARGWATAVLGPLQHPDAGRIDLLATVRAFLAHNGNTEAAAQALGIHRRTLAYRLGRAETLLGRSFSDPGLRAELWLALTVHGV